MVFVALREAMSAYRAKHAKKHTYHSLAKASRILVKVASNVPGYERLYATVSRGTLEAISRDPFYNISVRRLNTLCRLLGHTTHELLQDVPDDVAAARARQDAGQAPGTQMRAEEPEACEQNGDASMIESLDRVSKAVRDVIEMNDYAVDVSRDGEKYRLVATHRAWDSQTVEGTDLMRAMCELAEEVGIDLEDG